MIKVQGESNFHLKGLQNRDFFVNFSSGRFSPMVASLPEDEAWVWESLYVCDTPQKRDTLLKSIKDQIILKSGELESLERKQRIMTNTLHEYLQTHGSVFF